MDRRAFLATAGTGLALSLSGCVANGLGGGGLSEDEFDVGMSANSFLPGETTVSVGDRVVWGNNGTRGHTVTAYDSGLPEGAAFFASGGFGSTEAARDAWDDTADGNVAPGETFTHTFETTGEHPYFCIPHESSRMTGVVVVE